VSRRETGRRHGSLIGAFLIAIVLLAVPAGAAAAGPRYATHGWSGYGWNTRSHQVTGSLRLPSVSPARDAGAAFWAGFGAGPGIEQTGFTANMVGGHLLWTAWYELYPAPPVGFGRAAYSGDYVSMTVTNRGRGWFTLTVRDTTRHWTATVLRHTGDDSLNTSEVIVEAYGPPLARFAQARFYDVPARYGWVYRMSGTQVSPLRGHGFAVDG
jgi:hypothetical protein